MIELVRLYQYPAYWFLLEGSPTKEENRRAVEEARTHAMSLWSDSHAHVLHPRLVDVSARFIEDDDDRVMLGDPQRYPAIACVSLFRSDLVAPETVSDIWSELTLIWFQAHFAFPIDEVVVSQIHAIAWDDLATNTCP